MRNSFKAIELPTNFAQLLLDCQIAVKLSLQPLQNNICALLQLYSQGFQYYQSVGSYKYKFFDLKMRQIFLRKENDQAKTSAKELSKKQEEKKQKGICIELKKSVLQKNKYLDRVESQTKNQTNKESLQKILLVGQQKMLEVNMRIKHEIDYQNRLLERKLQGRSQRTSKLRQNNAHLKYNSTKTSLLSQSQQKKYTSQLLINHIFQQQFREHDQQLDQKGGYSHLETMARKQSEFFKN